MLRWPQVILSLLDPKDAELLGSALPGASRVLVVACGAEVQICVQEHLHICKAIAKNFFREKYFFKRLFFSLHWLVEIQSAEFVCLFVSDSCLYSLICLSVFMPAALNFGLVFGPHPAVHKAYSYLLYYF